MKIDKLSNLYKLVSNSQQSGTALNEDGGKSWEYRSYNLWYDKLPVFPLQPTKTKDKQ